jgi:hypothetical protein
MSRNQYGGEAPAALCAEARKAGMPGVGRRAVRNPVARNELEARSAGAATRFLVPLAPVEKPRAERHGQG